MLAGLIKFIIGLPLVAVLLGFVLLNRQDVTVFFSPVHDALTLPILWLVLAVLSLGFVVGALLVWLEGGKMRSDNRKYKKQIKKLEKEVAVQRAPDPSPKLISEGETSHE